MHCSPLDLVNYVEYDCELLKVRRSRLAGTKRTSGQRDAGLEEQEEEPNLFSRIIFQSNIQQMKALLELTAKSPGDPVVIKGVAAAVVDDPTTDESSCDAAKSEFRGISLNGKKWQVMVMGNNCQYISGSIEHERLAARIYDRFAIQHFGLRSKFNLSYTRS